MISESLFKFLLYDSYYKFIIIFQFYIVFLPYLLEITQYLSTYIEITRRIIPKTMCIVLAILTINYPKYQLNNFSIKTTLRVMS